MVSFAPLVDETAVWADLILPDHTYLEGWGCVRVSPDFGWPVVGSQQPVVAPVVDTRATADVLLTVARGLPAAADALPWVDEVAFLQEMVDQLPWDQPADIEMAVRWARFRQQGGWWPAAAPAPARIATTPTQLPHHIPVSSLDDRQSYPYELHLYLSDLLSDGRGASQPWLQGIPDPMTTIAWQTWVELHPTTANALSVRDGDVVRVTSVHGEVEAPVYVYPAIRPDTVAMPVGQGHTDCGRYARDRGSNPIHLVGSVTSEAIGSVIWNGQRVQVTPTGRHVELAAFENRFGVLDGFINQDLPGS